MQKPGKLIAYILILYANLLNNINKLKIYIANIIQYHF